MLAGLLGAACPGLSGVLVLRAAAVLTRLTAHPRRAAGLATGRTPRLTARLTSGLTSGLAVGADLVVADRLAADLCRSAMLSGSSAGWLIADRRTG